VLLIVLGVAAALLAALANPLGIGNPGFEWKQQLLLGVGIVVALVGVVVMLRAPGPGVEPGRDDSAP
jgi:hypothetical protein